jgi:hypothetical protein
VTLSQLVCKVCGYIESFQGAPTTQFHYRIANFGDWVQREESYAAAKLDTIRVIMCCIDHNVRPPISLSRFKDGPSVYQVTTFFLHTYTTVMSLSILSANKKQDKKIDFK